MEEGEGVWGKMKSPKSIPIYLNPIALRTAETPYSFGHSECKRVNIPFYVLVAQLKTL